MSQVIEILSDRQKPAFDKEDAWKKELATATTSAHALLTRLNLDAHFAISDEQATFKCLATESYINKMQPGDINDPLLRQV